MVRREEIENFGLLDFLNKCATLLSVQFPFTYAFHRLKVRIAWRISSSRSMSMNLGVPWINLAEFSPLFCVEQKTVER